MVFFSQGRRWRDPRKAIEGRHHLDPSLMQHGLRAAVQAAGIRKPVTCYTFRQSSWLRHAGLWPGRATHLLERWQDIRIIQKRISHSDLNATMIYTQVLKRRPMGVISPPDLLWQPLHVDTGSDNHCLQWTRLPKSGCGS